jgi:hypothetical protein
MEKLKTNHISSKSSLKSNMKNDTNHDPVAHSKQNDFYNFSHNSHQYQAQRSGYPPYNQVDENNNNVISTAKKICKRSFVDQTKAEPYLHDILAVSQQSISPIINIDSNSHLNFEAMPSRAVHTNNVLPTVKFPSSVPPNIIEPIVQLPKSESSLRDMSRTEITVSVKSPSQSSNTSPAMNQIMPNNTLINNKQKPKPHPITIPSTISTSFSIYPQMTLLKSPHFNFESSIKSQYTPPPMLSPFRKGTGLFLNAASNRQHMFTMPHSRQISLSFYNDSVVSGGTIANTSMSSSSAITLNNDVCKDYGIPAVQRSESFQTSTSKVSLLRSRMSTVTLKIFS